MRYRRQNSLEFDLKHRYVDGLINPRSFHRPPAKKKRWGSRPWLKVAVILTICFLIVSVTAPKVQSFTRQYELLSLFDNGRYLVLFQNDAEIRPSGGFIGSFAIIEAQNKSIKPLYFETNIYKLDDPFAAMTKITPPKPLQASIGERGWAMRDSNFAADFRESAPTIVWFFKQEVSQLTGPKKIEVDEALGGDYSVDGVIATTMTAFLDVLEQTGPIELPKHEVTITANNFFPLIQQVVERDYFVDPKNREINEPKTILQDLFPLAMAKAQNLPKTTQYKVLSKLLKEKKLFVYTYNRRTEELLTKEGWAGALTRPEESTTKGNNDFLAIIRSAHGGNKSSIDINPIYRYSVTTSHDSNPTLKLEITFEHTGTGEWPSGTNREYIRVLVPEGSQLRLASHNGIEATDDVDIGKEASKTAFGFWLHTEPHSSQNFTLEYELTKPNFRTGKDYRLFLYRQPGGNNPDITTVHNGKVLFQGRLAGDRLIHQ